VNAGGVLSFRLKFRGQSEFCVYIITISFYIVFYFRYLAARILQPEMVMFQIRPFAGWEITLDDFGKLSPADNDQMCAKYDSLPEEEKALLALKQADRTLMEGSEAANPGDLVFMVRETLHPTIQTIKRRGREDETITSWFARTNRFQLLARLKQYYLVESVSRAIDHRLNFIK